MTVEEMASGAEMYLQMNYVVFFHSNPTARGNVVYSKSYFSHSVTEEKKPNENMIKLR